MQGLNLLIMSFVQGIGEILPISSSINLFFAKKLFDVDFFNFSLKIALHAGSLIAILLYFGKEVLNIFKAFFVKERRLKESYFWHLVVGTIPVTILGYIGRDYVVQFNDKQTMGVLCIFFGIFLYIIDKLSPLKSKKSITIPKAFIVGLFQAIAIFPGVSRLGITITACRMVGLDRKKSIFFALLLAIPSILGSLCLELFKTSKIIFFSNIAMIGMGITALISIVAIIPCISFMEKKGFFAIMLYRCTIGMLIFLVVSK
ncbi:MAG: undecaprenyl-diphosphate phosphatase [Holosporales bacterium]|jgi:undecaprenyl-diphosphatase|nr:undecaprenyl-diphosphate phosphatase [Holosporales bacterium]